MSLTVGIHPESFEAADLSALVKRPCATINAHEGSAKVTLFLNTPAQCDELIRAAAEAKRLLAPPVQDLAEAEASPANPYGSVAATADEQCDADWGSATPAQRCVLVTGHPGPHGDATGHQWPAMTMGEIRTALAGFGDDVCDGQSEPNDPDDPGSYWLCTAQAGHSGDHVAFRPPSEGGGEYARWPQEPAPAAAEPAADVVTPLYCAAQHVDGFLCTRAAGHTGGHASKGGHVMWGQESAPAAVADAAGLAEHPLDGAQ